MLKLGDWVEVKKGLTAITGYETLLFQKWAGCTGQITFIDGADIVVNFPGDSSGGGAFSEEQLIFLDHGEIPKERSRYDTSCTDHPVCPYCGEEQGGLDSEDRQKGCINECVDCGKEYEITDIDYWPKYYTGKVK